MDKRQLTRLIKFFNILDLLGICFVTLMAFVFQILLKELPCPLCLMQRLGIIAIGFGFLLNIHNRPTPAHYALSLLAAVFTGFVAMRQILDHIVPGTGSYGLPFMGLHLYTWTFIFSLAMIIYTAIMLSIPAQYQTHTNDAPIMKRLAHLAFICLMALLIANIFSLLMECGIHACPDNPTNYLY